MIGNGEIWFGEIDAKTNAETHWVQRVIAINFNVGKPSPSPAENEERGIEQQAQMTEDCFYLRNGFTSATVPTPIPSLATYEKIIPFLSK